MITQQQYEYCKNIIDNVILTRKPKPYLFLDEIDKFHLTTKLIQDYEFQNSIQSGQFPDNSGNQQSPVVNDSGSVNDSQRDNG